MPPKRSSSKTEDNQHLAEPLTKEDTTIRHEVDNLKESLKEISTKLTSLIKSVKQIEEHLGKAKEETIPKVIFDDDVNETLTQKTDTDIHANCFNNNELVDQRYVRSSKEDMEKYIEGEALRIKSKIARNWETNIRVRGMAYWQAVRNKNLADKYDEWLQNQSMIIIPQKLQMRSIPDETENLRRRREQQVMDNYIAEKELLLLRCESQQIKYRETDSKMITDIESRSTGQIRKFLLSLWETQCKQNEEISHNRWLNRNLPWLSKYKENFLNRHQNENPYIRQSDDSRPLTYSQVL